MSSYFDEKKKKYVVRQDGDRKEFDESPGFFSRLKEGFQDNNTKAQLEAIRRKRQGA